MPQPATASAAAPSYLQPQVLTSVERELIYRMREAHSRVMEQLSRKIVGQEDVLDQLLISFFAGGHCLLVGVPGLAKTLMIRSLSEALGLDFRRIQFTPDLMPSDITGTDIIAEDQDAGGRGFAFLNGPVFTNMLLADEINRTPPKTQASLLEAMEEGTVHVGGQGYQLPKPFFVLATQNPIEQEGTYPLPVAAQDRFMFHIHVDYPDENTELEMVEQTTSREEEALNVVLSKDEILTLINLVRRLPIDERVMRYSVDVVRATRTPGSPLDSVNEWVAWGTSPRAAQALILGAKARAVLHGRETPTCDDVRAIALPVMRHRMACNFHGESEGVTTDDVVKEILLETPRPPGDTPPERDPVLGYLPQPVTIGNPFFRWLWGAETPRTRARLVEAERLSAPSRLQELETKRELEQKAQVWTPLVAWLSVIGAALCFGLTVGLFANLFDGTLREVALGSVDPRGSLDFVPDFTMIAIGTMLFGLAFLMPTAIGLFARQDWARRFGLFTYSLVALPMVFALTLGGEEFPNVLFLGLTLVLIYVLSTRELAEHAAQAARKRSRVSPAADVFLCAMFIGVVVGATYVFRGFNTESVWPTACIWGVGWLIHLFRQRFRS